MTYHHSTERNRNCDCINLIGEGSSDWINDWACVVTLLNQAPAETATLADKIVFEVIGNSATCKIGNRIISVDFNYQASFTENPRILAHTQLGYVHRGIHTR